MKQKQPRATLRLASILCLSCLLVGCDRSDQSTGDPNSGQQARVGVTVEPNVPQEALPTSPPIVAAARTQVGRTTIYDSSYVRLDYPGGDVRIEKGVCTDVVIRALRDALNMDLQKLVHEDMTAAFSKYPKIWGLRKPDSNIDHRRVPNLQRYFERKGYSIAITKDKRDYMPGDVVTCAVPPNRPHIMIVSDRRTDDGVPLVIHNIGRGAREEARLFDFRLTGHYRIAAE